MNLKRIAALGCACALLLTACGGKTDNASSDNGGASAVQVTDEQKQAAALTVDGVTFTAQDYAAAYLYNKGNLQTLLSQYGLIEDDFLETEQGASDYHDKIADMAEEQLEYIAVCENQMAAAGLTLDEAKLDEQLASQTEQLGGEDAMNTYLEKAGISMAQYRRFASMNVMVEQLRADEAAKNPEAVRAYFDENYLRCKHVLIKTVDDSGNELSDQAGLEAKAKEVAEKARGGADFDALIAEYNEDPGMTTNPDGYVFAEGTMVDEFYEGTKALAENAVSDPIKTSYGWHVILRLPLRDADYTANQTGVTAKRFAALAAEWVEHAKVEEGAALDEITYATAAAYAA